MNGVVVNVRGINASGKSTAVREFCRAYSLQPQEVMFVGEKFRIMTDGVRLVFGWYKPYSNSEGCDALRADKDQFKSFFEYALKRIKPRVVVYEKQIWSTTYKFTSEIAEICNSHDYSFIALQMCIRYETALNRLFGRNGGNMTNLVNFDNRYYQVQCARKNMKEQGMTVFDADVDIIPEEKMGGCITWALAMFGEGTKAGVLSDGFISYSE